MPFKLLNPPRKREEQGKPAGSTPIPQSPPTPMPIAPIKDMPSVGCTVDFEVDPKNKTYCQTLHGNCKPEIDSLNALPLMTRRGIANHMKTDDPELRRMLDEVKQRKTSI